MIRFGKRVDYRRPSKQSRTHPSRASAQPRTCAGGACRSPPSSESERGGVRRPGIPAGACPRGTWPPASRVLAFGAWPSPGPRSRVARRANRAWASTPVSAPSSAWPIAPARTVRAPCGRSPSRAESTVPSACAARRGPRRTFVRGRHHRPCRQSRGGAP